MTISYSESFAKSLLQWRGSMWKAVLKELIIWYIMYYAITAFQAFVLNDEGKKYMEQIIAYFSKGVGMIPLTFVLGFFVAAVLGRWWEQFNWISWPDKFMIVINMVLPGPENLRTRRCFARWANLQAALAWRLLSVRTKARFPTPQHLVDAGLMTPKELLLYESTDAPYGKWFVPIIWMSNLLTKLRADGVIKSDVMLLAAHNDLMGYRVGFAMLMVYDWIVIPLVYVQVVAIATYGYFALCLFSDQPKLASSVEFTLPFPLFTTLQFLFYCGWLKVAQFLMHPFGDDDDDFELNWILDRNFQIAYMIGDNLSSHLPDHLEDPFERVGEHKLPHTKASMKIRDIEPADSLASIKFSLKDQTMISIAEQQRIIDEEAIPMLRFQNLVRTISMRKKASDYPEAEEDLDERKEENLDNESLGHGGKSGS